MKKPTTKRAALRRAEQIPSFLTRGADGQWTHTYVLDMSDSVWRIAVRKADEGDLTELTELLLSETATDEAKGLIDDLLDRYRFEPKELAALSEVKRWSQRYQARLAVLFAFRIKLNIGLKRKRGRQRTPVYARSEIDARLDSAFARYRAMVKAFGPRPELIPKVAAAHGLDERAFRTEVEGRRGSSQRTADRRAKAFKGG